MRPKSQPVALLFAISAVCAAVSAGAGTAPAAASRSTKAAKKQTSKNQTSKKKTAATPRKSAPVISPAERLAAREFVELKMEPEPDHIRNVAALEPFFRRLSRSEADNTPVHVLQYGDSHTASDDWADTMRKIFQAKFGNGGPGFTLAGSPFRGYRRYDIRGYQSLGWATAGTVPHPGDGQNGLGGLSITASATGEYVSLKTTADPSPAAERLELFYLTQPGGGSFTITDNGTPVADVGTNAASGTGIFQMQTTPGEHLFRLQTTSSAPVRLFGWVSENQRGLTWETLGINGAQARMLPGWDRKLWAEQLQRRDPALIVLAYGTNEALYPRWTREAYQADLLAVIAALKEAVPGAALLLIGPPECGRLRPFPYLQQVIEIQSETAKRTGVAFWDWALHMKEAGGRARWVRAGYSQPDYTHLTAEGYRLLGRTVAAELLIEYGRASHDQPSAQGAH